MIVVHWILIGFAISQIGRAFLCFVCVTKLLKKDTEGLDSSSNIFSAINVGYMGDVVIPLLMAIAILLLAIVLKP